LELFRRMGGLVLVRVPLFGKTPVSSFDFLCMAALVDSKDLQDYELVYPDE
jgi:hypothetical protein